MTTTQSLPPEILQNIFSQSVVPTDAPLSFPANTSQWPWPLLSVSKQWYDVALMNPDLWGKHDITISRRSSQHDVDQIINYHTKLITPQNRFRLSIELSCASRTYAPQVVSKIIKPNASGVVNLRFHFVPFEALACILNSRTEIKFSKIASLEMNFQEWGTDVGLAAQFLARGVFNTPTLKNLVIYNSHEDQHLTRALWSSSSFSWADLIYLSCNYLDYDRMYRVLSRCKRLVQFSATNIQEARVPAPAPPAGRRLHNLLAVTLAWTHRAPVPDLLMRLPIPWENLKVLDLGGQMVFVDLVLFLLQRCRRLEGLTADVRSPPPNPLAPLNLFQVHLPYLKIVRLDVKDESLLNCLVVPELLSLHVNQHDRLDAFEPPILFPAEAIVQMLLRSRCVLVDFQRRRRNFYTETPKAIDPGPADLVYLPYPTIHNLFTYAISQNAQCFILTGLVLPRPFLDAILMGRVLPVVEHLECAVEPQDLEVFVRIVERRVRVQVRLRSAKALVLGIPGDYLIQIQHRMSKLSKHYRGQFEVDRPDEGLSKDYTNFGASDSSSASGSSTDSDWMSVE